MKIKTDIEFISFSDGICDICSIDEDGNKTYKYRSLGFTEKILGFKRYFTAAANQIKTDRVIRIPKIDGIDNHDIVEIENKKYDIELIQNIFDSNPQCIDLTLRQLEVMP